MQTTVPRAVLARLSVRATRFFARAALIPVVVFAASPALAQHAALYDELTPIFPDLPSSGAQAAATQPSSLTFIQGAATQPTATQSTATQSAGVSRFAADTARGVPAGVHVLLTSLPPGATVYWQLTLAGQPVPDARGFRLLDVPVEQNTGLGGNTEALTGKPNPHVIRRAPFRIFEALEPSGERTTVSDTGVLALRIELPIAADAQPGLRNYELVVSTTDPALADSAARAPDNSVGPAARPATAWRETLHWDLTVHTAVVPPTGPTSPGYTNWFSPGNIAQRHGLEMWSEPYWTMLGRYADLMARGRQNTFWIVWSDFITVAPPSAAPVATTAGAASAPAARRVTLDRVRLQRYVQLFLDRGFTRVESGHLAGRHEGQWESPRLDLNLTGSDVTTEPARAELAAILAEIRPALAALGVPEKVPFLQHLTDEPIDLNADAYRILAEQVRRGLPGVQIFEATMSLKLVGAVDHWCPQVQEYQRHRDFFAARQQAGDHVWVYTCLAPGGPWINRLLDQERLRPLYIGWALVKYDLTGFLHWGLNQYRTDVDPFVQSVIPWDNGPPNYLPAGDSHIIYPGRNGPLSGQRFEAQRIGMEDAELLRLVQQRDPARAGALIDRVLRAFDDYEKDVSAYRTVKRALLDAADSAKR